MMNLNDFNNDETDYILELIENGSTPKEAYEKIMDNRRYRDFDIITPAIIAELKTYFVVGLANEDNVRGVVEKHIRTNKEIRTVFTEKDVLILMESCVRDSWY